MPEPYSFEDVLEAQEAERRRREEARKRKKGRWVSLADSGEEGVTFEAPKGGPAKSPGNIVSGGPRPDLPPVKMHGDRPDKPEAAAGRSEDLEDLQD